MKKIILLIIFALFVVGCKNNQKEVVDPNQEKQYGQIEDLEFDVSEGFASYTYQFGMDENNMPHVKTKQIHQIFNQFGTGYLFALVENYTGNHLLLENSGMLLYKVGEDVEMVTGGKESNYCFKDPNDAIYPGFKDEIQQLFGKNEDEYKTYLKESTPDLVKMVHDVKNAIIETKDDCIIVSNKDGITLEIYMDGTIVDHVRRSEQNQDGDYISITDYYKAYDKHGPIFDPINTYEYNITSNLIEISNFNHFKELLEKDDIKAKFNQVNSFKFDLSKTCQYRLTYLENNVINHEISNYYNDSEDLFGVFKVEYELDDQNFTPNHIKIEIPTIDSKKQTCQADYYEGGKDVSVVCSSISYAQKFVELYGVGYKISESYDYTMDQIKPITSTNFDYFNDHEVEIIDYEQLNNDCIQFTYTINLEKGKQYIVERYTYNDLNELIHLSREFFDAQDVNNACRIELYSNQIPAWNITNTRIRNMIGKDIHDIIVNQNIDF